ncbi:hypothetical protein [Xenorhabdus bovienii]|uniref:Uncharacterized protein n=1 Tax=Xenorhabdus bovienii str. feltiae Moldova TaxID=1398200 RepID=A0A077NPQ2_XENBV|nr:hypothetical protein [Xenorhabdus bovienii]CDG86722.1 hypothetical protein XBFFR1_1270001 [Xenorhabdus bovienii str. feltiae France]CDG91038.1 hypothetical protein XBFFL1_1230006 [Xenorhabdus bovienii str. feltiae Florida]CDH00378.1 hypothetical protein XBFM1_1580020 [Xenorhabdus bovienii str. feltiae Moldova]
MNKVSNNNNGKIIELRVNGAPLCYLNTQSAVSVDYLFFLKSVVEALSLDSASLEHEANLVGKTIDHKHAAFAAIKDPKAL